MKSHKMSQRHVQLMGHVAGRGSATINELAAALGVSGETIRRDARALEARGEIIKLHGALALPAVAGEAPFDRRLREHAEAKRAIARHAAKLVHDGDSLMLDTGTTTVIFAQELRAKRGLTVVTNSTGIARTLAGVNGTMVYMAGGAVRGDSGAVFGPTAVEFFARFRVRQAFISIGAINAADGPMDAELAEAEIAQMALSRADVSTCLSDSSKFGKSALVKVCGFAALNRLVTEAAPPADLQAALDAAGVAVEVAGPVA